MKKLKKIVTLSLAMVCILGSAGCSTSNKDTANKWPEKIVLAQMPNENNPNADSQHEKFAAALSEYLGIEVGSVEGTDYTAGIEGMASKNVDVMLVSPMSYFQAKERANAELLVSTPTAADYKTAFITKADRDDINSLKDLKGKTFAFVDQASSSGYLYQKAKLIKELQLDTDKLEANDYFFSTVAFSGGHPTSLTGVTMGDYDAAAVAKAIITQMVKAGQLKESDIKVIGETDVIPNPCYVVRGDLPQDLKDKIKEFFMTYDDESYFEAVHENKDIRFVEVTDETYTPAKEMLDLLKIDMGDK